MDLTKGSCEVHAWRKEEGERRAPNKAGPIRPPLLNGIKWECIGQGLKGHYMDFIMK